MASMGRRVTIRSLLALLPAVLIALGAGACGGVLKDGGSAAHPVSESSEASAQPTATTSSVIPPGQSLRGDGDADNPSDIDGNGDSDSASVGGPDNDNDAPTRASYDFPDSDDRAIFVYGRPPSAVTRRAITNLVKRYYAAASSDDGAAACPMISPGLAGSVAEDYGQAPGPSYLRGGRTCPAVMSKLFQHYRGQLQEAITVVAVRVDGGEAHTVISSRRMPASVVFLVRRVGSWRLQELLGQPLP